MPPALTTKFSSVQLIRRVQLFATPWIAAHQAFLSISNPQSLLKLMSIELVMPSNHLILCIPFSSCLKSFPASGSFQVSQFFASGGQSISFNFKISPSKEQVSFNFMAAVTVCSDSGAQAEKVSLFPLFPHLLAMKWWGWMPWSLFFECWVLSQLFHSPLSFSSRGI